MAVSAGCWNCISGRVSILRSSLSKWQHTTPSVREAPLLSRAFRRDHSGTIPAPGSFAKFKGSVLAGNPSPSESTSNSQHEKQYACDCIQSLILRDALGSSPAPRVWGGTTAHQPCSVPSTPCRNIPNSLGHCKHVPFIGYQQSWRSRNRYRWHNIPGEVKIVFHIITG